MVSVWKSEARVSNFKLKNNLKRENCVQNYIRDSSLKSRSYKSGNRIQEVMVEIFNVVKFNQSGKPIQCDMTIRL